MPETPAVADRATLLEIYRRTVLINRTDERFRSLLTAGKLQIVYYPVLWGRRFCRRR